MGDRENQSDSAFNFAAFSDILGLGVIDLAIKTGARESITINESFAIFEDFLFFYLERHPVEMSVAKSIEDYLLEASDCAKSEKYGEMLAYIIFIWTLVCFDDFELSEFEKQRKKGQREGGKRSHWLQHGKIIMKHLRFYKERQHKVKKEAIAAIEIETGTSPLSENTFNSWWKKYSDGKPVFLALQPTDSQ